MLEKEETYLPLQAESLQAESLQAESLQAESLQAESLQERDKSNGDGKELITEPPNEKNNTSEILTGGSEFDLEEELENKKDNPEVKLEDTPENNPEDDIKVSTENSRSSSPEIEEQEGGGMRAVIEYKINYLLPDDEQLVNSDKIKSTVKRYIDNYNSDAMKKYKQLFKIVYQKYSNKRYLIDNTDTEIIVSRVSEGTSKGSKIGKRDIVYEIFKPKYIFYNKNNNLIQMKYIISNKRQELQIYYQSLVNKLEVQQEEKKQFEKARKQFIDLLERYYIYDLYNHQINNISLDRKSNIVVQELHGFLKDNAEKKFTLDGNLYTIDNSLVERINEHNSNRLNIYNELMVKLQSATLTSTSSKEIGKKTEKADKTEKSTREKSTREKIIDEIKEYLKGTEENAKLNNEIKDAVRIQNTYVDYIIYTLPNN
jgi:hypothetical protein